MFSARAMPSLRQAAPNAAQERERRMENETSPPTAIYHDGYVVRRHTVTLEFGPALDIFEDGHFLAAWPYGDIRRLPAAGGGLRLRAVTAAKNAFLEIVDPATQREVESHCKLLGGEARPDPRIARRRVAYVLGATVVAGAFLWGGVPRMAAGLAPFIPIEWEKKLGEAADEQTRQKDESHSSLNRSDDC